MYQSRETPTCTDARGACRRIEFRRNHNDLVRSDRVGVSRQRYRRDGYIRRDDDKTSTEKTSPLSARSRSVDGRVVPRLESSRLNYETSFLLFFFPSRKRSFRIAWFPSLFLSLHVVHCSSCYGMLSLCFSSWSSHHVFSRLTSRQLESRGLDRPSHHSALGSTNGFREITIAERTNERHTDCEGQDGTKNELTGEQSRQKKVKNENESTGPLYS